jgi:hypothetical protein
VVEVGLRRSLGALALLPALVAPLSAAAAQVAEPEPRERIRIAYVAPPECPDESEFVAQVRARVATDWEAAPDELARRIDVEVSRHEARFVAMVRFVAPTGERVLRQVAGSSCTEVVDGLALITALAIGSRVEATVERTEAPPLPAPTPTASQPPPPAVVPAAKPHGTRLHVRFGASATVTTAVGPEAAFGAAAFGTLEWSRLRAGLAFGISDSGRVSANGVPADFRLIAGRLDACPVALPFAAWLWFEPCLTAELGQLRARSHEQPPRVTSGGSGSVLWAAPGAAARLVGRFDPLVLVVEGAAKAPLVREVFYVEGGGQDRVFQVPTLAFSASAGAGLRF